MVPVGAGLPPVVDASTRETTQKASFEAVAARLREGAVAPKHTVLTKDQAATALARAFKTVTGRDASDKTLTLLTAQWGLETGNGAAMMNYNFGGIKGRGPSGLYTSYKTKEGSGASEITIVDKFRAYASAEEGATDYVRVLRDRFPKAFEAAQTGEARAFVHALKTEGYFTADEETYTRAIAHLSGDFSYTPADIEVDEERRPDTMLGVEAVAFADQVTRASLMVSSDEVKS